MRKPFTVGLTLLGAVLCLIHYFGHDNDPIYLLFYALSIPAWIAPLFVDVTRVNIALIYALTIASYAVIGYIIDYFIARTRERRGVS